jgi:hypothetical protein
MTLATDDRQPRETWRSNEKLSKLAALFLFLTLSSDFVAFLMFFQEFVDNKPASSHF